jgi:hypothetical protein
MYDDQEAGTMLHDTPPDLLTPVESSPTDPSGLPEAARPQQLELGHGRHPGAAGRAGGQAVGGQHRADAGLQRLHPRSCASRSRSSSRGWWMRSRSCAGASGWSSSPCDWKQCRATGSSSSSSTSHRRQGDRRSQPSPGLAPPVIHSPPGPPSPWLARAATVPAMTSGLRPHRIPLAREWSGWLSGP